jgi:hypothetical protein
MQYSFCSTFECTDFKFTQFLHIHKAVICPMEADVWTKWHTCTFKAQQLLQMDSKLSCCKLHKILSSGGVPHHQVKRSNHSEICSSFLPSCAFITAIRSIFIWTGHSPLLVFQTTTEPVLKVMWFEKHGDTGNFQNIIKSLFGTMKCMTFFICSGWKVTKMHLLALAVVTQLMNGFSW